ncbi:RNA-directed DNA polymerase [Ralstonia pickettii]|uniref:RNA-directed DNA polymerase n=1 Tax=Ralstonia pickettii TaxID=329 RepID=UPI00203D5149|nr:RNA-directed DNA polymerase [Ralstonia pickettii]MCM3581808.1 RNA-directed DNA polymerase [Ralstonia pickettii]
MATRTTTTRTTSCARGLSADYSDAALPPLVEVVDAYYDCRQRKRNTHSALAFEQNLERNLYRLHRALVNGSYLPGPSKCFVIDRPKHREVWAAEFPDRIVHHMVYNRIGPRFERSFITDSCACIKGRGTLYGAQRLEKKVRSITQNWSRPAHYLKCDLANFFVSIDKRILLDLLVAKIPEPFWRDLTELVLMHDPRENFIYLGDPGMMEHVPPHKRLMEQPAHLGLPIGNLSSQFFANVYLNELDQFVKHKLRCRHYIRYVDDFVLLHESAQWLNAAHAEIEAFLPRTLGARLNPTKTILQPVARGIDFVGQVIRPWVRHTRKRTLDSGIKRVREMPAADLYQAANSYFGLLRQATGSHVDRAKLANVALKRGHAVNRHLTKIYRSHAQGENQGC